MSLGVRGARVGAGPRGRYVHMGRHGVYYRKSLPPAERAGGRASAPPAPGADSLAEIESADALAMRDASSAALLDELNARRRRPRLLPLAAALALAAFAALYLRMGLEPWAVGAVAALGAVAVAAVHRLDAARRTTVLLYELEPEEAARYRELQAAFADLASCARVWHVEAEGAVADPRRNAGVPSTARRRSIRLSTGAPPGVLTNVEVPAIPAGAQTLHLLPDQVLVVAPEGVGAVRYEDLTVERREARAVEEEPVPADATVAERVPRFVNRDGRPDRRFKGNPELPVVLYEELHLGSASGLNERLRLSRLGAGARMVEALRARRAGGGDAPRSRGP